MVNKVYSKVTSVENDLPTSVCVYTSDYLIDSLVRKFPVKQIFIKLISLKDKNNKS